MTVPDRQKQRTKVENDVENWVERRKKTKEVKNEWFEAMRLSRSLHNCTPPSQTRGAIICLNWNQIWHAMLIVKIQVVYIIEAIPGPSSFSEELCYTFGSL